MLQGGIDFAKYQSNILLTFLHPSVREDYRQHLEECTKSSEDTSYQAKDFGRTVLRLERSEESDRVNDRGHRDHEGGNNLGCDESFICKQTIRFKQALVTLVPRLIENTR